MLMHGSPHHTIVSSQVDSYDQDLARAVGMSNIRLLKINHKTSTSVLEEPDVETTWQQPGRGKLRFTLSLHLFSFLLISVQDGK